MSTHKELDLHAMLCIISKQFTQEHEMITVCGALLTRLKRVLPAPTPQTVT